jgi:hypothetical protein
VRHGWCQEGLLPCPNEPVSRLEAQHVGGRNTIQMTADSPSGKEFGINELVDGLAIELPAATELSDCQPCGTGITSD